MRKHAFNALVIFVTALYATPLLVRAGETLNDQANRNVTSESVPPIEGDPSLLGPDRDGNGSRDDVDEFILNTFKTPEARQVMLRYAIAAQRILRVTDTASALKVNTEYVIADHCLLQARKRFRGPGPWQKDFQLMGNRKVAVSKLIFNTKQREDAKWRHHQLIPAGTKVDRNGITCE